MTKNSDVNLKTISPKIILVLLFSTLIYLYYPFIQNYSNTPKWIAIGTFMVVLAMFSWKKKIPWSIGMSIWFLFVLNYLIQCYWSYNFWDSVVRATPFILSPLAVITVVRYNTNLKSFYGTIAKVVSFSILPIILYTLISIGLTQLYGDYNHQTSYNYRFTFGHRNQYSQFITLLIPLIFAGVIYAKSRSLKAFYFTLIILIYITAVLLMSRAVFIILFGIYPLGIILYSLKKASKKLRLASFGLLGMLILGGIVIIMSPSHIRNKIPVIGELITTSHGSGNERIRIWTNSIELWKEKVVLGHGSGNWKIEILQTPLIHTKAENSIIFFQRAHNEFIHFGVENGALGVILLITFFIVGIVQMFKSNIHPNVKGAFLFGALAFIFIANFSFPLEKVELLIPLFLFLLPGLFNTSKAISRTQQVVLKTGALITTVGIIIVASIKIRNERLYFDYKMFKNPLDLMKINETFYTIDAVSTPIAWKKANILYGTQNYAQALEKYNHAILHNPNHVHVINNLGSCYYALGKYELAKEQYKKALSINPSYVETLMNYSALNLNMGNVDEALNTILKIRMEIEPKNYRLYIIAIGKEKFNSLIEIHTEPNFENYLLRNKNNEDLLYEISVSARLSGACYEDELRIDFMNKLTNR